MALTLNSVLHYWEANYGLQPIVGGNPVFSRASPGTHQMAASKLFHHSWPANKPRYLTSPDGVRMSSGLPYHDAADLLLELGATNLVPAGKDFANATYWTIGSTAGGPATVVANQYEGVAGDRVPGLHGNGSTFPRLLSSQFTVGTSTTYTVTVELELKAGSYFTIQLRENTGGGAYYGHVEFDLSTGTVLSNLVGTGTIVPREDGRGYRCTVHATTTSATTASLWLIPGRYNGSASSTSVALFSSQVELTSASVARSTSYIHTTAGAVTRSPDSLYWTPPPLQTAFAAYLRMRVVARVGAGGLLCFGSSEGANSLILRESDGGNAYGLRICVNGAAQSAYTNVGGVPGDTVEFLTVNNGNGTSKMSVRVNGGAVSSVTPPAVSVPATDDWGTNTMYLNSVGAGQFAANRYSVLKIVTLADLASGTDAGKLDELADFTLSPDWRVI